jgi:hypothetical protein
LSKKYFWNVLAAFLGVLLAAAAVVSFAGASYANGQVAFTTKTIHDQLAAEKIFFPKAGSEGFSPKDYPTLQQYAGQQLLTGAQAEAYADHYIGKHLQEMNGGRSYSELSAASRANPTDLKAKTAVETAFKGDTLRGMLLNAFAFSKIAAAASDLAHTLTLAGITLCVLLLVLLVAVVLGNVKVPVNVPVTP